MDGIDFTGQGAIVTGAGSGIGLATAKLLASRGARVLVNDADPARAAAAVNQICASGGVAQADVSPVGSHAGARGIAEAALAAFGRIDVLVNNAGIALPGPFDGGSDQDLNRLLEVNLLGPYALMRAVWPAMSAQGYGRIVNTSSSAALGSGISGPYAVSKAGIIGLTKEAALAGQALGIVVNAIMPSAHTPLLDNHPDPAFRTWMATHMPAELVAAVTAFLAGPQGSVTGEVFSAGGGLVSRIAFMESRGIFDKELTPETVGARLSEICDMADGRVLRFQADHQSAYAEAFPGYPA